MRRESWRGKPLAAPFGEGQRMEGEVDNLPRGSWLVGAGKNIYLVWSR